MWNQNENNWKEKEDECWSRNETKDPLPSRCDWERGPTCLSKTGRSRSAPLFLSLSLSSPAPAPPPLVFRERERERQAEGGMDDYAREMMELKTLVTRTLEKKGVLAKIRVQIPHPSSSLLLLTFLRIWLTTCGSSLHCLLLPLTFDFHAPHLLCTCWRNFLVLTKSTALFRFQFVKQKGISRLPYFCLHCQLECEMLIYTHAIPHVPRF